MPASRSRSPAAPRHRDRHAAVVVGPSSSARPDRRRRRSSRRAWPPWRQPTTSATPIPSCDGGDAVASIHRRAPRAKLAVMPRPPIILDCDPGHDDAVAIVVAARHTDLLGITTVAGNAPLDRTTYNARVMRDLLGLDVEVHSGAERPLVAEPKHSGFVHGASGLDGADLPAPTRDRRRHGRRRFHHRDLPLERGHVAGAGRPAHEHRARAAYRTRPARAGSRGSR